ncbi:Anthocyanidin reductase-like [Melia azedarach]|uniref:Anthocyanidin reductase-like n=1 Tax=Melia azedarach TaxID=155640 RepID=A0ACC1XSI1_MELAZ|nr:Anthocyanidin reductase-like [Melia azedarach]
MPGGGTGLGYVTLSTIMDSNGSSSGRRVCVTGGEGFVGSWLIKKLLDKGFTVHTTLRPNLEQSKIHSRKAIRGCEYVFHVATAVQHTEGYQFKNIVEACVGAAEKIATFCVQSGTVKRLIYTSSVTCGSPLKEDGSGYKDFMDETCWTPLHHPLTLSTGYLKEYIESKMKSEKEIMRIGKNNNMEVVALGLGMVAGDTDLPYSFIPISVMGCLCQIADNEFIYKSVRDTEELLGKIPFVHIDDVCEAHIFCMEKPSISGSRFFCTNVFISSSEMANYYQQNYPDVHIKQEYLDVPTKEAVKWGGTKLEEKGFVYKHDMKKVLDDSFNCGKRTAFLP